MSNKLQQINNEYRDFLTTELGNWTSLGLLYAITGCIKGKHRNHKTLWDNKLCDIRFFFNKLQRELTGARYWNKEIHRQVKVLLFPESASLLHYHGVLLIPHYYFKKSKDQTSFEIYELRALERFNRLHKEIFMNSCDIKDINSIKGWIDYSTKSYDNPYSCFSMRDFTFLP